MLGNAAISVRPGTGFARFGDVAERAAEVGRWKASSEDRSFQTIGRCADGIHFLMLAYSGATGPDSSGFDEAKTHVKSFECGVFAT